MKFVEQIGPEGIGLVHGSGLGCEDTRNTYYS
jgi:hypothetical protein